jgi:osmotically-inducible protein OsmY
MISTGRLLMYACSLILMPLAAGCAGGEHTSNPPPFAATTSPAESDSVVAANVTAALHADVELRAAGIEAVVRKGDVRLIGRVGDAAQRDRAERVARDVAGVHSIHNELTLGATS